MPSGYTAKVADGSVTELRDFALLCARAMGALIMMRDEPLDAPIPEAFEPSNYHTENLAEATERLKALKALTPEEIIAEAEAWNKENEERRLRLVAENNEKRARYDAMLGKVYSWQGAPDGLKSFMLDQLEQSRKFDTSDSPSQYVPDPRTPELWWAIECQEAARNIDYHAKQDAAERERTAERNAWLAQLRAALP